LTFSRYSYFPFEFPFSTGEHISWFWIHHTLIFLTYDFILNFTLLVQLKSHYVIKTDDQVITSSSQHVRMSIFIILMCFTKDTGLSPTVQLHSWNNSITFVSPRWNENPWKHFRVTSIGVVITVRNIDSAKLWDCDLTVKFAQCKTVRLWPNSEVGTV